MHQENSRGPRRFDNLPQEVQTICISLLDGLRATIGQNLYGVYLYGAMVFPETRYINDIDFYVIVKRRLTAHGNEKIRLLHKTLASEFPPLGTELDGYYILFDDTRQVSVSRHQVYPDIFDDWKYDQSRPKVEVTTSDKTNKSASTTRYQG